MKNRAITRARRVPRECLSRAVTHVCVLTAIFCAFCLLLPVLVVNNDDGSNWEWLDLRERTRQRPTRNACCGRETARCRSKIWYLSKLTAALRGPPCDSTALVWKLRPLSVENFSVLFTKANVINHGVHHPVLCLVSTIPFNPCRSPVAVSALPLRKFRIRVT